MLEWYYKIGDKKHTQSIVMELKVINKRQKYESVRQTAIEQATKYANCFGQKEANIIIFDRDNNQGWTADEPNEHAEHDGVKLEIWKLGAGIFVNIHD